MGALVITGPTASGKSELALALADQLNGEIISADSAQVYRGMDIGTAKPDLQTRQQVVHHTQPDVLTSTLQEQRHVKPRENELIRTKNNNYCLMCH